MCTKRNQKTSSVYKNSCMHFILIFIHFPSIFKVFSSVKSFTKSFHFIINEMEKHQHHEYGYVWRKTHNMWDEGQINDFNLRINVKQFFRNKIDDDEVSEHHTIKCMHEFSDYKSLLIMMVNFILIRKYSFCFWTELLEVLEVGWQKFSFFELDWGVQYWI